MRHQCCVNVEVHFLRWRIVAWNGSWKLRTTCPSGRYRQRTIGCIERRSVPCSVYYARIAGGIVVEVRNADIAVTCAAVGAGARVTFDGTLRGRFERHPHQADQDQNRG